MFTLNVKGQFSPTTGRNNRSSKRIPGKQEVWIRPDGGFAVRACRLVDWSETGVRLRLQSGEPMPKSFKLLMTRTSTGKMCRMKWRRGQEVGAEFV